VAEETAKTGSAGGAASGEATVIKKYANRRLYNTATSTYVTLDDLSQMVRAGTNFIVYDAKTGEDITRSVLTQIIFEEENKGGAQTLLPINFLRQLIRFYGDSMQGLVPGYLNMSIDSLTKEQEKLREQVMTPFGGDAMKSLEEQTKRNMAMFQDAMKMFNPFAPSFGASHGATPSEPPKEHASQASGKDDFQVLKEQMAAMQRKLDSLSK
jgi:polyhydroxyalkanoate synthesis repressor PhaR